jgi:hypothetical protein
MEQIGHEIQGPQFDLGDGKFEPERRRVVLLLPVLVHSGDIELGGLVQPGLSFPDPRFLQRLEGGQVLLGLAAQAALLIVG